MIVTQRESWYNLNKGTEMQSREFANKYLPRFFSHTHTIDYSAKLTLHCMRGKERVKNGVEVVSAKQNLGHYEFN